MLIGEYLTTLGDKNRVGIPKRLRDNLNGKVYITRGYEQCLIMVDSERWDYLVDEINKSPLLSLNVRDTKRFIIGGATEVEYDSLGRFVIPESLKAFAKIDQKIVFLGVGEWAEIWSEERWQEKLNDLNKNVADLAERLSSK
ncbi:Transcriptional regulator MraZ [Patescibacteria group bacterium]|nr:Transcriptional regulator MraZ [Patescibacteria group bacterium]